jgi:hypothetical protein
MYVHTVTKWILDDFNEKLKRDLEELGWEWMDAYDPKNDHPLRYGHYFTYDILVVEKTADFFSE